MANHATFATFDRIGETRVGLKRHRFNPQPSEEPSLAQCEQKRLLEDAKRDLGYSSGETELRLEETRKDKVFKSLNDAILKVGGPPPLTRESVEAYKEGKLHETNRKAWLKWWWKPSVGPLYVGTCLALLALIVLCRLGYNSPATPALASTWVAFVSLALIKANEPKTFSWRPTELKGYQRHVPERTLEYALKLQRVLKQAGFRHCESWETHRGEDSFNFYVEELVEEWETRKNPDPFLIVSFCINGGHNDVFQDVFHIDYWDEQDYKPERLV